MFCLSHAIAVPVSPASKNARLRAKRACAARRQRHNLPVAAKNVARAEKRPRPAILRAVSGERCEAPAPQARKNPTLSNRARPPSPTRQVRRTPARFFVCFRTPPVARRLRCA